MTPTTQTTDKRFDRRTFLTAAGAGSAALLAGCISAPQAGSAVAEATEPEEQVDESLPDAKATTIDSIAADPAELPPPVDWDEPREHEITLRTQEHVAEIEPGVTFKYMTYEGQVPGPMIRIRKGDTVHLRFEIPEELNSEPHNVDFHAVYGPGGGAVHTTRTPGGVAELSFKAMYAGVHIYHCAVPAMDHHISAGMFGAIVVEPEDGLSEVDRELYFGQHELYTKGDLGETGHHAFDHAAMTAEEPTYVVFNGEAYGYAGDRHELPTAEVGETVRVFFANGGPNLMSAFHPIGNVWSRLYRDGDLLSPPARNVETTPVAPGTVMAAEMDMHVPGPVKLVDHALSRAKSRGTIAVVDVHGEENPEVYDER